MLFSPAALGCGSAHRAQLLGSAPQAQLPKLCSPSSALQAQLPRLSSAAGTARLPQPGLLLLALRKDGRWAQV